MFRTRNFCRELSFSSLNHPPDSSIGFSPNSSIPETGNVVIKNKQLSEAVLESIIGRRGVSPSAKQSLAERLAELLNKDESTVE